MALLIDEHSGQVHTLPTRTLVGRSTACTVRISDNRVSAEHASLSWQRGQWILRDLGSKNGTFLNGERLPRGARRELHQGDLLAFGDPELRCLLKSASEPGAFAHKVGSSELIHAVDDLLPLPSEDHPEVCLIKGDSGGWVLEQEGTARSVEDKEIVEIEGEPWILRVPVPTAPTEEIREQDAPTSLRIRVSLDEETVEVLVTTPAGVQALDPRSHYYTLATLARLRIDAEEKADLPEPARGWVEVSDLCRMLELSEAQLNVEVYRIRRDFRKMGLDASTLIERRKASRQLRLGKIRVSVETLR